MAETATKSFISTATTICILCGTQLSFKWSYTEWQREIDRADDATIAKIAEGTPDDWGRETHLIATQVYLKTPQGFKASYDYVAEWTPVIEQQFLKGGIRLAKLLDSIYGK